MIYHDPLNFLNSITFFQSVKSFFSFYLFWTELGGTKFTLDIKPFREHFARYQTVCTPRVTMGTNSTIDPFAIRATRHNRI